MDINETLIRLMLTELEVLRIQLRLIEKELEILLLQSIPNEKELEVLPMPAEREPSRVEAALDEIIHQMHIDRTNDDRHRYCF